MTVWLVMRIKLNFVEGGGGRKGAPPLTSFRNKLRNTAGFVVWPHLDLKHDLNL